MKLEAVIPCVGYDDFLTHTIDSAVRCIGDLTVLTAPSDMATIRVAEKYGTRVLTTESWWVRGKFNKARALNTWIEKMSTNCRDTWLLVLDADIYIPPGQTLSVSNLDAGKLYSARRRMCTDETAWEQYHETQRALSSFPFDVQPLTDGRLWGTVPTSNPAGLLGYFQLWNPIYSVGAKRFMESPTAADYDVCFGSSFPEGRRAFLSGFEVLHLGPTRLNWAGRRSPRWYVRDRER